MTLQVKAAHRPLASYGDDLETSSALLKYYGMKEVERERTARGAQRASVRGRKVEEGIVARMVKELIGAPQMLEGIERSGNYSRCGKFLRGVLKPSRDLTSSPKHQSGKFS